VEMPCDKAAWCCAANADMTEKMVVPTWGRRLAMAGVNGAVVIGVVAVMAAWVVQEKL